MKNKKKLYIVKLWIKNTNCWTTFNRNGNKDDTINLSKQLVSQGQRVRVYYDNQIVWNYKKSL